MAAYNFMRFHISRDASTRAPQAGAQFYHTILKSVDLEQEIANDRMENVNAWLKQEIHQYGGPLEPDELMRKVTGESFDPKYFVEYIKEKFSKIYF
ncbi:MAG: hypothetical protein LLG09_01010 [Negativicutes bacterium]|nr:hypothetical protein [Negativicutes bacterium]